MRQSPRIWHSTILGVNEAISRGAGHARFKGLNGEDSASLWEAPSPLGNWREQTQQTNESRTHLPAVLDIRNTNSQSGFQDSCSSNPKAITTKPTLPHTTEPMPLHTTESTLPSHHQACIPSACLALRPSDLSHLQHSKLSSLQMASPGTSRLP